MTRCKICRRNDAEVCWQPWGPGETIDTFTAQGWHYRGFPYVSICFDCQKRVEQREPVQFAHKGKLYVVYGNEIRRLA